MNQNNEYFVNLNKEELLNKNVVVAKNTNNKLSILIKDLMMIILVILFQLIIYNLKLVREYIWITSILVFIIL